MRRPSGPVPPGVAKPPVVSGPKDGFDGSRRRRVPVLLVMAAALLGLGCGEAVRPVLGNLKIGAAASPFHMPVLENEKPPFEYPRDAWRQGVGGEAVLRIHITRKGTVDSVLLVRSAGHPSLDSAAVAGALKLRYRPAKQGTEPVAVWGTLPVRFPMPEEAF